MTFKMTAAVQYLEEQFERDKGMRKGDRQDLYVRPIFQLIAESHSPNWAHGDDAYVCRFGTYNLEELAEELPQLEELEEVA